MILEQASMVTSSILYALYIIAIWQKHYSYWEMVHH